MPAPVYLVSFPCGFVDRSSQEHLVEPVAYGHISTTRSVVTGRKELDGWVNRRPSRTPSAVSTRPILRNAGSSLSSVSSSSSAASARRVHFPPPTALASIHPALPASAYDRSCIVVAVNPCALPPRGARYYAAVDPPPKQARPQTPYRQRANPFDELPAEDAEASTTDESDATPTAVPAPAPSSQAPSSKPKRASNSNTTYTYTRFAPSTSFNDMACLQGF